MSTRKRETTKELNPDLLDKDLDASDELKNWKKADEEEITRRQKLRVEKRKLIRQQKKENLKIVGQKNDFEPQNSNEKEKEIQNESNGKEMDNKKEIEKKIDNEKEKQKKIEQKDLQEKENENKKSKETTIAKKPKTPFKSKFGLFGSRGGALKESPFKSTHIPTSTTLTSKGSEKVRIPKKESLLFGNLKQSAPFSSNSSVQNTKNNPFQKQASDNNSIFSLKKTNKPLFGRNSRKTTFGSRSSKFNMFGQRNKKNLNQNEFRKLKKKKAEEDDKEKDCVVVLKKRVKLFEFVIFDLTNKETQEKKDRNYNLTNKQNQKINNTENGKNNNEIQAKNEKNNGIELENGNRKTGNEKESKENVNEKEIETKKEIPIENKDNKENSGNEVNPKEKTLKEKTLKENEPIKEIKNINKARKSNLNEKTNIKQKKKTSRWEERGVGFLTLLKRNAGGFSLIVRSETTKIILLNSPLLPEMKINQQQKAIFIRSKNFKTQYEINNPEKIPFCNYSIRCSNEIDALEIKQQIENFFKK
ncbi:ran-specific gtpase-activating protein [Anaeramoeba flamelloides]|uniref:Ran-specific gtpase-activating protein n=1 Tax=Anaeramoeba flamelloides TaxID=1746091 RepID=A0AAV7YD86_9EUKA|nr:ran-specific gtpase-activating protein [Anaeramoeba flamelloides]